MEKTFSIGQRVQCVTSPAKIGLVTAILTRPRDVLYLVSFPSQEAGINTEYVYNFEIEPAG